MMLDRRKFLIGILGVAAAPMIVRASSLMPVRAVTLELNEALLELALVDIRLAALIESMRQTKEMIGAQIRGALTIPTNQLDTGRRIADLLLRF